MTGYALRTFVLPVDLEDEFVAELWAFGALGFESHSADHGDMRLDAYFVSPPSFDDLAEWRRRGVREVGAEQVIERDWLAAYRETSEPFDVGVRFRVDPRDETTSELAAATRAGSDRRTLLIPARTAFGTGSHESTGLAIAWLEDLELTDLEVLDVGTGSGILSFVAEMLGAHRVVGFDVDAQAVCIAKCNAHLNNVDPLIFAGKLSSLRPRPDFDLALVNILPENILSEMPCLVDLLKSGGRVISSGNLASRRDELLALWAEHGFSPVGEKVADEWAAWLLKLS